MLKNPANHGPVAIQSGSNLKIDPDIGLPDVTNDLRVRFKELIRWFVYDEKFTVKDLDEAFVDVEAGNNEVVRWRYLQA